jgi:hypothetical protein
VVLEVVVVLADGVVSFEVVASEVEFSAIDAEGVEVGVV